MPTQPRTMTTEAILERITAADPLLARRLVRQPSKRGTDCLLFDRPRPDGRAQIKRDGRAQWVPRVAWSILNPGDDPTVIRPGCGNLACVSHLEDAAAIRAMRRRVRGAW